jgi:hypothetical protein
MVYASHYQAYKTRYMLASLHAREPCLRRRFIDMGNDGLKLISMGMCGSGESGR